MAANPPSKALAAGIVLTLLSCYCQATANALVKHVSGTFSMNQILFMQSAVCLLLLLPICIRRGSVCFKTRAPTLQLLRATIGLGGYYATYYTVRHISVTDTTLLLNAAPLFIPFVLWVWKKTPVQPRLWKSLAIGFFGILLILHPGLEIFQWATFVGILSGMTYAFVLVCIRFLHVAGEPTLRTLFFLFAICLLVTFPFALTEWTVPDSTGWAYLIGIGLASALTQAFLTIGLRLGSVQILAPLFYSSVVFAFLYDWLLFDHTPHAITVAGILLVIFAGSKAYRREGAAVFSKEK